MADNLELVCVNDAADAWVDNVPDEVSTGYQCQNTASQATWNGFDKSACSLNGLNLEIDPSGIIDDSGSPFVVKTQIVLTLPTTGFNHFLKVVAGSTAILKEIEFTTDRGTYNAAKNAYYNGSGQRILNWVFNEPSGELHKISADKLTADLKIGSYVEINSSSGTVSTPSTWNKLTNWAAATFDKLVEFASDRFTAKEKGIRDIDAFIQISNGYGATTYGIAIYKNGSLFRNIWESRGDAGATDNIFHLSTEVNLAVNDYIEIYNWSNGNIAGTYAAGGTSTKLTISSPKDLF